MRYHDTQVVIFVNLRLPKGNIWLRGLLIDRLAANPARADGYVAMVVVVVKQSNGSIKSPARALEYNRSNRKQS